MSICKGTAKSAVIAVLVLGGIVALAFPHVRERMDYRAARTRNTAEAWESYVTKHPAGERAQTARSAHDDLLCAEVEKNCGDPNALTALLRRCLTPQGAEKFFALADEALWATTAKADTIEGYSRYLDGLPCARHTRQAMKCKDELVWRRCQESPTFESYEMYLKECPWGDHVKEAKNLVEGHAYETVCEKGTVDAYKSFLEDYPEHIAAKKRLRELRYQQAVNAGTLETWKAFYEQYKSSLGADDDSSEVDRMRESAREQIECLLYEKIMKEPTLELCQAYLASYGAWGRGSQVDAKMELCLFEEASRTNDLGSCFDYMARYPDGPHDSQIRERLDAMIFQPLGAKGDLSVFDRYLELSPKTRDVLLARMEPLLFEWTKRVDDAESYERYFNRYPDGPHLVELQAAAEPAIFRRAQEEDWYSRYEDYIAKYPNGQHVEKARERIAWLKANVAVVEVNFPSEVEETESPYHKWRHPYWGWETVFKETGGKVGFKVTASGYILSRYGVKWVSELSDHISRREVFVHAGRTARAEYGFGCFPDHDLCNSHAIFTWTGEDAGGHPLRIIEEKVHCTHTDCPDANEP